MNERLPRLVVRGGAHDGATVEIPDGQEVWLGRSPEASLVLEEAQVAPLHARVTNDHWGVRAFDAQSGKGTWVNGESVSEGRVLAQGDIVTLGRPGTPGSVALEAHVPERSGFFTDEAEQSTALDDDGTPIDESEVGQQARALAGSGVVARSAVQASRKRGSIAGDLSVGPEIEGEAVSFEAPAERSVRRGPRPVPPRRSRRPLIVGLVTAVVAGAGALAWVMSQEGGPVILGVTPPKAEPGQEVSIAGRGFGSGAIVRFDGQEAPATSIEAERLIVKVPASFTGKPPALVRVTVEIGDVRSATLFLRVFDGPRIDKISPEVAMPGEEIVVTGQQLEGTEHQALVRGLAAEVLEVAAGRVRIRVPDVPGPQGQVVPVSVKAGEDWSNAARLILGRLPIVVSTTPAGGQANRIVTLDGYGFAEEPAHNLVTIGGRPALVLQAAARQLSVVAPGGDAATSLARAAVAIEVGGVRSANPIAFALSRPAGTSYLPRFWAGPGGSERALVACEAGPVMLLADAAGAPSTARRAVAAADVLTAHFAATRPGRVEQRDTAIVVSGRPLVTATAADAAAHGANVSPAALAAHWTALLTDLTTLFVARERPTLLLERTPAARVLDEMWRQGQRQAKGGGVPAAVVSGLGADGWRAMHELALNPVAETASSGGLAFVGGWRGELKAPGQTAGRPLRARLTLQGGRLAGEVTVDSGKVSGELPLRGVSLRGRALQFTFDYGDGALVFEGTLAGARLSGSVRDEYGGTGTLSLTLAE